MFGRATITLGIGPHSSLTMSYKGQIYCVSSLADLYQTSVNNSVFVFSCMNTEAVIKHSLSHNAIVTDFRDG